MRKCRAAKSAAQKEATKAQNRARKAMVKHAQAQQRYVTNKREDTTKVTVNNLRNDSDGRTVTDERPVTSKSREHVPNPLTEGQGVKRSVPLSAEDKKKLAAERKRRYRAARSAAAKEEERARNRARMAMVRHAVKFNLPKPPKKAPVDFSKYFISKQK